MMNKWVRCYLGILFFFYCGLSVSAEKAVNVSGYGTDQKRAIADGLVQAIRQLKGVSVSSKDMLDSLSARVSLSNRDGDHSSAEMTINQTGALKLATQGIVSRYDVHSLNKQADLSYVAEMTVYVSQYEKFGLPSDTRRKLAVMPFHLDKKSFSLLGDLVPSSRVEQELRNKLIDQFTQSRRVAVLDREFGDEFAAEKEIWTSNNANLQERSKLGNVLGVDYLVVGRLSSIKSSKHTKTLELTGETNTSYSGSAQLDYKIIHIATRQVKWSDSIRVTFSDQQIREMLKQYGSSQAGITQFLANDLAQKALSTIYPIRVVAVKGSTVVLNQGGRTLHKGDILDVFMIGEEMFDPYTKESLGQLEEFIAKIKVVRVNAKTTYAKVIDGEAELIEKDFIVRRL